MGEPAGGGIDGEARGAAGKGGGDGELGAAEAPLAPGFGAFEIDPLIDGGVGIGLEQVVAVDFQERAAEHLRSRSARSEK